MKTVAYSCPYVPAEWIAAHNLRPYLVVPTAAQAISVAADNSAASLAGACPFARAAATEALVSSQIDAYVCTSICDQRRRETELAGRRSEKPVFMMHVPATWQRESSAKLYESELERLGRFLKKLGGRAPEASRLADSLCQYDMARAKLSVAGANLPASDVTKRLWKLYQDGPQTLDFPDEVERSPKKNGVPLAVVGGPLMREALAILDALENGGARVAVNFTENGADFGPAKFNRRYVHGRPMRELVRAYFDHICHPFKRPNDGFYHRLSELVANRGVRGILFVRYVWCDIWHAELAVIKARLSVPVVDVDFGGDDSWAARVRSRVEALLEIV